MGNHDRRICFSSLAYINTSTGSRKQQPPTTRIAAIGIVPNSPTLWRISGNEAPQIAARASILNVSASFIASPIGVTAADVTKFDYNNRPKTFLYRIRKPSQLTINNDLSIGQEGT
jgi:hypothetical protein